MCENCRFCNLSKNFVEKNNKNRYEFASYHTKRGKKLSDRHGLHPQQAVYLIDEHNVKDKSSATLSILKH